MDINRQDDGGRTALMLAASEGNERMIKELVEAGADITIVDGFGATLFWR